MSRVIEKILTVLQRQTEFTAGLLDAALAPKGKIFYRKQYRFSTYGPQRFKTEWAEWYRERQSFYSLLNQMKRDGLIEKRGTGKNNPWSITVRGRDKLSRQTTPKERRPGGILMRVYPEERYPGVVIVAFDIPEKMRKKRQWLRENLIALDLTLLQKSVWMGAGRLPQEFINDLRAQHILKFIHIFSVDKHGAIQQVKQ